MVLRVENAIIVVSQITHIEYGPLEGPIALRIHFVSGKSLTFHREKAERLWAIFNGADSPLARVFAELKALE